MRFCPDFTGTRIDDNSDSPPALPSETTRNPHSKHPISNGSNSRAILARYRFIQGSELEAPSRNYDFKSYDTEKTSKLDLLSAR